MTAAPMPSPQPAGRGATTRLETVAPEDMPEVAEIAYGLYQQDEARLAEREQRRVALEAAAEAGVPAEYMERAAGILHRRRVDAVRARRRRRTMLLAGALAVALSLTAWWGTSVLFGDPPPAPVVERFDAAPDGRWTLDANPETRASLTFGEVAGRPDAAVVRVDRFAAREGDGAYYANLDSVDGRRDLAGLRAATVAVRGDGLGQVRLYLERGAERWRSPAIPVTGEWRETRIPLDQFEYQTRDAQTGAWRVRAYRPPGEIDRLSFKVGTFVNDVDARGEVAIDSLWIE